MKMLSEKEEYDLFIRFCKERDVYQSLIRQTTKERLLFSLQEDRKNNEENEIHCPLYLASSVGYPGFSNTKEGYSFWWEMYYDFKKWTRIIKKYNKKICF